MEYAFSILMFVFAALLMLYAALIGRGGFNLIPRGYAASVDDKKAYAKNFAKVLRVVAAAPAVSGLIALVGVMLSERDDLVIGISVIILIVGTAAFLTAGVKMLSLDRNTDNTEGQK